MKSRVVTMTCDPLSIGVNSKCLGQSRGQLEDLGIGTLLEGT